MPQYLKTITELKRDEKGVTALEYGLIASLIAVVIITAVWSLGNNLSITFNGIASHFGSNAINTAGTATDTATPVAIGTARPVAIGTAMPVAVSGAIAETAQ